MAISRIKRALTRYLRGSENLQTTPSTFRFEIGSKKITGIRLLQRKNSDTLGKVGMLSWSASMGEKRVKIYECRSAEQARFIEQLSNDDRFRDYLPECYYRKNEFLVVEWVEGRSVTWSDFINDSQLMDKMTAVHHRFHVQAVDYWPDEKCYFFDYLESRFNRFRNVLPLDDFVSRVMNILQEDMPRNPLKLSHPDVTPVNVIYDGKTQKFKAIDNDLFTQTSYYLVDLFTTQRSMSGLPEEVLREYLVSYLNNGGNLAPLINHESFFNALWTYRLVGTSLQEGLEEKGVMLARRFLDGTLPTHPVIETIRKQKLY